VSIWAWNLPARQLTIEDRQAWLERRVSPNDDGGFTRLVVDLRGVSPGSLQILSEGFFSPIARFFGAQDLKIGDKTFDALYVIKASPSTLAASIFGGPQRERLIRAIRTLGRYPSSVIDLSRERLRIQTGEFGDNRALDERMIEVGRVLTLAALGVKGSVSLWEDPGMPASARCPVCACPFRGPITTCRKCRTPHHHECWLYAGGCSTYACGQRNS
jgi:hypothetical protein